MDKIESVAAYIRVSSEDQVKFGYSLAAQELKLRQFADANNMRIVEWYRDEGVSGRKAIKNRPELQRMINDAASGKFTRIIFITLDRFFRSTAEYHEAMKRLGDVKWTATEEKYDLTNAQGRMLVNAKLMVAELEADQTGERIKRVNDYKVATGQPVFGVAPLGYKVDTDAQTLRKKVVKDEETAGIVIDMFDYFKKTQSVRATLLYINDKYDMQKSYNSARRILQNPIYCGRYRDNDHYIDDPYFTIEEFERIQDMMKRNKKQNTHREYIFGGLLCCPECGRIVRGGAHRTKYGDKVYELKAYRCPRHRTNNACSFAKCAFEVTIERSLLQCVESFLETERIGAANAQERAAIQNPKKKIESINAQIDRLNYAWQTGKIRTVEMYEAEYQNLVNQLEKVKQEQDAAPIRDFSNVDSMLRVGWRDAYKLLDDKRKREFWRSFIKKIEWDYEAKEVIGIDFF